MAWIVVLSVPAWGHVNAVLPIVAELVRRGHQVVAFNEAGFEPIFRSTGADFVAYPADSIRHDDFARSLADGDLVRWMYLIFRVTPGLIDFVVGALRDERPDVVVFDGVALWAEMSANKLHLPSVSISTTFVFEVFRDLDSRSEWFGYMRSVATHLSGFAAHWMRMMMRTLVGMPWRLPLVPRQGTHTVVLTSRDVHPPSPFFDNPRFSFVGCSVDSATRGETFDFSRLDGGPLLYVSLGTLHTGRSGFFGHCIEAFADFPGQVLMSVGRGSDRSVYAGAPANFIIEQAVPQLDVLQRTSVFLTHAGLNSMHEALWFGVPMVALPQTFEQLRNAQSMERMGAGVALSDEVYDRPVRPAAMRAAVDSVLAERSRYAAAAASLGRTLRDAGGFRAAADDIERVAGVPATVKRRPPAVVA